MLSSDFLTWFKSQLQNNDIMHMYNNVYEAAFEKFKVDASDSNIKALEKLLEIHCTDVVFNKLVVESFKNFKSAYSFKLFISMLSKDSFSNIPLEGAENILMDVYNDTKSASIKNFVILLTFSPADFLKQCMEKYDKLGFKVAYEAFSAFIVEEIQKYKLMKATDSLRLIGFLCQNDVNSANRICNREYLNIKFREDFDSLSEIYDDVILKHKMATTNETKLKGYNLQDTFLSSLQIMALIAPDWNKIKASSVLRNTNLPKTMSPVINNFSDSDIVEAMAGKYNIIPDSAAFSGQILTDLIVNHSLFAQYSQTRKIAVSNFLNSARARFNLIIKRACENIITFLNTYINGDVDRELNNAMQFGASREICSDTMKFYVSLREICSCTPLNGLMDKASFICNSYIPMLKYFKERAKTKYASAFNQTMMQFNNSNVLQVFSVTNSVSFPEDNPEVKVVERVIERIKKVLIEPTPTQTMTGGMKGGSSKPFDDMYEDKVQPQARIEGGETASTALVNNLTDLLTTFTSKFTTLYRQLITELSNVPLQHIEKDSSRAYGVVKQFNEIAIGSNYTTMYISGVFGDKDYNTLYKNALNSLINAIQSSDLKGFEKVCDVLKSMVTLFTETKNSVTEFQNKYINSSRAAAELLTVSSKSLKIENDLHKEDYIKFNDAVKRIYNSIYNNKSTNDKIQERIISDYSKSIEDREEAIKAHYKSEADVVAFKYLQETMQETDYQRRQQMEQFKVAELAINARIKDAICYYNRVVDPMILQFRKKIASNTLTHEQLDRIMEAWTTFKHTSIESQDFKKLMGSIGKHLNAEHHSINEYANLVECIKKLMKKGNYIAFLRVLHTQAGINVEGFKWEELEDKMYEIIALKSVKFYPINKFDAFLQNLQIPVQHTSNFRNYPNIAHNHNNNLRAIFTTSRTYTNDIIGAAGNVNVYAGNVFAMANVNDSIKAGLTKATAIAAHPAGTTSGNIAGAIADMFASNANHYDNNEINTLIPKITLLLQSVNNFLVHANSIAGSLSNEDKTRIEGIINRYMIVLRMILFDEVDDNHIKNAVYGLTESNDCFELRITESVYKALSVDLFGAIDNYITSRYTGVLSLPLNINQFFKGGDNNEIKQEGGSWFDIGVRHVSTDGKVIGNATPFYIIAYNVIKFYFTQFIKQDAIDANSRLKLESIRMKIHKVSYLYPLYKIYRDNANIFNVISETDFKLFVAICNKIWTNNNDNNPEVQLKKSITALFNELNGAIVYGGDEIMALLETGSSKDTINNLSFSTLKANIKQLTESIATAISESINTELTPEQNSVIFESILSSAMKQVKEQPEQYQMAKLKKIITESNDDKYLQEYYKFMELAVMPLITCANSYNNLFTIFGVAEVGFDGHNLIDIDLSQRFMNFPIYDHDAGKGPFNGFNDRDMITMTVSEFCRYMHTEPGLFNKYKTQLFEHPIIYEYNRLLLNNAFVNFHIKGKFMLPNFWVPIDEDSYPTQDVLHVAKYGLENSNKDKVLIPASYRLFKQIFPECTGKTLYDYFDYAATMFAQDCEQYINAFISYPGISDRTRKFVVDQAKSLFAQNSARAMIQGFGEQEIEKFKNINFAKSNVMQQPPIVCEDIILPFIAESGAIIEQMTVSSQAKDTNGTPFCQLGDTAYYVAQKFPYVANNAGLTVNLSAQRIAKCEYTWIDWAIINIALADRVNVALPYKLVGMLQNNAEIAPYIKSSTINPAFKGGIMYQQSPNGSYPCLLTQNIIARSILPSHKDSSEYALLSKAHVASIVGMLPYIISTLYSLKETTSNEVLMDGGRFNVKIQNLIDILKLFYVDISSYVSYIPFMADATELSTASSKPHIFAELCDLVASKSATSALPTDFAKMEWANMWFFNSIPSMQFPDFKNRDRFEWMNDFAPEIVKDGVYKQTYQQTIQALARNAWMSLIAKTFDDNMHRDFTDAKLDAIINNVINIMCECAPEYTQRVIDTIITMYNPNRRAGLTGGSSDDQLEMVNVDDPSLEPYKEDLKLLESSLARVSVGMNEAVPIMVQAKKEEPEQTTITGVQFGASQFVNVNSYTLQCMQDLANTSINDFKFNPSRVKETAITMETNYPKEYDNIMAVIRERIAKIINRTNEHCKNINNTTINIDSSVVNDVVREYRGLNVNINEIMDLINDTTISDNDVAVGGVAVDAVNIIDAAGAAVTVRTRHRMIVAGTLGTIVADPGNNYFSADVYRKLRQVYGKVAQYKAIMTRLSNRYVQTRPPFNDKYSLYQAIIGKYFEIPTVFDLSGAGALEFTCKNLLTTVIGLCFMGDVRAVTIPLFNNMSIALNGSPFNISFARNRTVAERIQDFQTTLGLTNVGVGGVDGVLDFAAKVTLFYGLAYIHYCENVFAMPFIRDMFNNKAEWPLEALFYCKANLDTIRDNLLADTKIIDQVDSWDTQDRATPAVITKYTLARMVLNGMYLDAINNPEYRDSIKDAIQSVDNYIMFRSFALKYNNYVKNATNRAELARGTDANVESLFNILEEMRKYEGKEVLAGTVAGTNTANVEAAYINALPEADFHRYNDRAVAASDVATADAYSVANAYYKDTEVTSESLRRFVLTFIGHIIKTHAANAQVPLGNAAVAGAGDIIQANDFTGNINALFAAASAGGSALTDAFRYLIYGRTTATNAASAAGAMSATKSIIFKDTGAAPLYVAIDNTCNYDNVHTVNSVSAYLSANMLGQTVSNTLYNNTADSKLFGGKKLSLKGGVIRSREEFIYAWVRGVATNPTSRLIYYDASIQNETRNAVLQSSAAYDSGAAYQGAAAARNDIAEQKDSTYAIYMYNPNVLRPKLPESRNILLESIAATHENMITPYRFNINIAPGDTNITPSAGDSMWKNGSAAGTQARANINRKEHNVGIFAGAAPAGNAAVDTPQHVLEFIDNNIKYKQIIKRVIAKDIIRGLELVPISPIVTYNLFSPRKPIYNATFNANAVDILYTAPLAQYEYSDYTNDQLRYRNNNGDTLAVAFRGNDIGFYLASDNKEHNSKVSFSALHQSIRARECGKRQYLPKPAAVNPHASIAAHIAHVFDKSKTGFEGNGLTSYDASHNFAFNSEINFNDMSFITIIDQFIEKISAASGTMFNNIINNNGNRSQGFAFLKGGSKTFGKTFYNVDNIAGVSAKEVLGSAYGAKLDELAATGKQLYESIFRKLASKASGGNASDSVYAMSLSYFGQTPLSISSMYEQVAFPSIIFNTGVYNSFADRINTVVNGVFDSSKYKSSVTGQQQDMYTFIKKYINYCSKPDNLSYEKYKFNPSNLPDDINNDGGFVRLVNYENALLAALPDDAYSNFYVMPSLNSSYMGALARYTWYNYNDFTNDKQNSKTCIYKFDESESSYNKKYTQYARGLLPTTIMQFIKFFDASTTYLYTIFEIGKQLSRYDIDSNTEVAYSSQAYSEPFDIRI